MVKAEDNVHPCDLSDWHKVINTTADGTTFSHDAQTCEVCQKGEECLLPWCIACFPCAAGFYKAAAGTDSCIACPANTYVETEGSQALSLCTACQAKSSTLLETGQSSRRACACDKEYYLIISNANAADEALLCQTCPKGAVCESGECALRNPGFNCSDGTSSIVGDWILDSSTGQYELTSCPAGFEMKTTDEGSIDLQECFKCPSPSTYILQPDVDTCQPCPPGLVCAGDATFTAVIAGSDWVEQGSFFKLESCPAGYYVSPAGVEALSAATAQQQLCLPCEKGFDCVNTSCVTCTACSPGFYKAAVSTEPCAPCPTNTYVETEGSQALSSVRHVRPSHRRARQVRAAGEHAPATRSTISSSAIRKPRRGALVPDVPQGSSMRRRRRVRPQKRRRQLQLHRRDQQHRGNVGARQQQWPVRAHVVPCRVRDEDHAEQGSADLQECFKCPSPSTYILNPDVDECQPCPPGLTCSGDATLAPKIEGSVWVEQGSFFKLESCPAGYYVSPAGVDTLSAARQGSRNACRA